MNKMAMQNVIERALAEEQGQLVERISQRLGITDKKELGRAVMYVMGFVALIPSLLESVATSSFGRSVSIASSPFMKALEQYLLDENDLLPGDKVPGILGLLDDAYYVVILLLAAKESLPNMEILPEINLPYARNVFTALLGKDLADRVKARAFDNLKHLMEQQQRAALTNMASVNAANARQYLERAEPSASADEYYSYDTADAASWYDFQSSSYDPGDQFNEESAGWPGGAYENPDSGWYQPDDY